MSAPTAQTEVRHAEQISPAPRIRLWPGVLLVALLWAMRAFSTLGEPSPLKFFVGLMITPMVVGALLIVWWLFLSRARWSDRGLIVGVLLAVAAATTLASLKTFPPMALIMYGLPILTTAWVGWLLVTFALPWRIRKLGLLALFVLLGGGISLLRVEGMDGSFAATITPRWRPTAEDQLLAELRQPAKAAAAAPQDLAEPVVLEAKPGDWTGFRGPQRDGRLTGVRIDTAWDKTPPKELWKHRVGPGWSSFAVVDGRLFTQEQRGEEEMVVCYDAATGSELWAHRDNTRFTEVVAGPGPRGTPTFDNGAIYALGASGHLNCLDAMTGKLRWSRDVLVDSQGKLPQWGYSSSPLVVEGIVSVFAGGPTGKSVLGYRIADGELAWSAGEGKLSYCSTQLATIGGRPQLLMATDAGLTAFAPATGEVLWQHEWPTEGVARIVQPTLLEGGDVLIGTGMGVGTRRISVGGADEKWPIKELWTSRSFKPYFNDQVVQGDYLYGFDGPIVMCVGLADGRPTWRARGYGSGQILLLADQSVLLVLTETGEVALVAATPDKHQEIARFKAIEGKTWNHPVIAHGKLFVRNAEEMACFELKLLPDEDAEQPTSHAAARPRFAR